MKRTILLTLCGITSLAGVARAGLLDLAAQADAIVIADVTPQQSGSGAEGTYFLLSLHRTLKGSVGSNTIVASFVPIGAPAAALYPAPVCGIFLLQQAGSQWHVVPQDIPLRFDALYMPSDRCSGTDGNQDAKISAADRVIREYLHSAMVSTSEPSYLYRLFSLIRPRESTAVAAASRTLSESTDANRRLLGLAWRIGESDPAAVEELAASLGTAPPPPIQTMLVTSLSVYSNPDPNGVAALGTIAVAIPGGFLEQAVALTDFRSATATMLPFLADF